MSSLGEVVLIGAAKNQEVGRATRGRHSSGRMATRSSLQRSSPVVLATSTIAAAALPGLNGWVCDQSEL